MNNLEKDIKNAFELICDVDLDSSQRYEILRRAKEMDDKIKLKNKILKYKLTALFLTASAALAFLIFTNTQKAKIAPEYKSSNYNGSFVLNSYAKEKLIIKNGEIQIFSSLEWEWDTQMQTIIATMNGRIYFYDEEEYVTKIKDIYLENLDNTK